MPPGQILREHRLVAQKKTAHGAPWTKEDVRELRAHSKARTPLPEIAKKMKRTERALRRKAGISRHRPRTSPLTLRCCKSAATHAQGLPEGLRIYDDGG